MKRFILLAALAAGSCAPDYTSIRNQKPNGVKEVISSSAAGSVGFEAWRFGAQSNLYASKNQMVILNVRVTNKSDTPWQVSPKNFLLKDSTHTLSPLSPKNTAAKVKLPRGRYWLWSFMMGFASSSSCNGANCSSTIIPIPVGLIFGVYHFSKATRYNDSLLSELSSLEFRDTVLLPKTSLSGLLYFRDFSSDAYDLQFRASQQDSFPKLIIPLNKRYSQYLIRDFKNITP